MTGYLEIIEFDKSNTQNAILNKLYKIWIIITMICVILTWCLFNFAHYEYSLSYSTFFCKFVLVPVKCQNPAEKLWRWIMSSFPLKKTQPSDVKSICKKFELFVLHCTALQCKYKATNIVLNFYQLNYNHFLKFTSFLVKLCWKEQLRITSISKFHLINKTKDWALVQTAALVINKGVEVRLG